MSGMVSTVSSNLVFMKAYIISDQAPTDTTKLWIDLNGIVYFHNGTTWVSMKGTYID